MVHIAQTFHENWKCDPSRNGGGEEKKGFTSTHTTSYGVHVPTHQFNTNVGVRTTYTPANFGHFRGGALDNTTLTRTSYGVVNQKLHR